jgi:hypothetical protein
LSHAKDRTVSGKPLEMGTATTAVFDDTCGNLIQIAQAT